MPADDCLLSAPCDLSLTAKRDTISLSTIAHIIPAGTQCLLRPDRKHLFLLTISRYGSSRHTQSSSRVRPLHSLGETNLLRHPTVLRGIYDRSSRSVSVQLLGSQYKTGTIANVVLQTEILATMSRANHHHAPPPTLEAKLVVLGAQNVGKTSLVHRFVKSTFIPPNKAQSTVGASFLTTKVHDAESGTDLRLQIWDTAGQERFRSISKLYYRGAHAAILCYDVGSLRSFEEMGGWLRELREQTEGAAGNGEGLVIHVVGTKADVVAADPKRREVPFERCIGYVAEQLYPEIASATPSVTGGARDGIVGSPPAAMASPQSNRSSGFWGSEAIWDCCHEVSSKDGEGIEEVFRVITRKLVEQQQRRLDAQAQLEASRGRTPGIDGGAGGAQGYFDLPGAGQGSFRLGHGDKRRSWLGFPTTPGALTNWSQGDEGDANIEGPRGVGNRRCC